LDDPLPWKPGAVAPFAPLCTPLTVYCCDRKSRAASAQSFTLWQQATIEMTRLDHSIIACSWHAYIGVILLSLLVRGTLILVLFFAHMPFVVNRTFNATPPERLQQYYHSVKVLRESKLSFEVRNK